jgi:uncharacterized phage protein gp47/JayE
MPWMTPTLRSVREMTRGEITAKLAGASFVGNSVLRVLADAMSALAHLTLRYIDWLSRQLLPDTAETEWLDRHGDIWLVNADGSIGRKVATMASGQVTATGTPGAVIPGSTQLSNNDFNYETLTQVVLGVNPTPIDIRGLNGGAGGNLNVGDPLPFTTAISGVDSSTIVVTLTGGADQESDDELRARVLKRIRQPPMGGAAYDYEAWALAVPGVTRAWATEEMGIGTVTVRFMMDDLRADNNGFPYDEDIQAVEDYLAIKRPVTVKDTFVMGPIPQPIDFNLANLVPDNESIRANIIASVESMLMQYASPGQTIFAAWKYSAVMAALGVVSFDLTNPQDDVMPSIGHMAVMGSLYVQEPVQEVHP